MKRRDFLAASAAAGLAPLGLGRLAGAAETADKQVLEMRVYHFADEAKRDAFDKHLAEAAIPALNRAGVKPVGVFVDPKPKGTDLHKGPDLYVLLPHASLASFATAVHRLLADEKYIKGGEGIVDAPKKDPAYLRIESVLMISFDAVPKVETHATGDERVFQLRIYEAHNAERGQKKIEMFNTGGEVAIFRKCGMNPVFFGESLIGTRIPNLTYMLGFDNPEAQKAAWGKFMKHPDWKRISRDPQYRDTVSRITNIILKPAASSQI